MDQLTTFLNTRQKTTVDYGNNWSITLSMKSDHIFAHFQYNSGNFDFNPNEDEYYKKISKDITVDQLYQELISKNDIVYEPCEDTWH